MGSKRKKKAKVATPTMDHRTPEMRYLGLSGETSTATNGATSTKTLTPTSTPTVPTESHAPMATPSTTTRAATTNFSTTNFSATKTHQSGRAPLRTVISDSPYKPARRIDSKNDFESDDSKTEWWLGPVLVLSAALMMGLGWMHIQRSNLVANPVGHPSATAAEKAALEIDAKVKFYRSQLGHKLNRDRMNVEIQNSISAPRIDGLATKAVDRSMMMGVPMMQENYVPQNYGPATKTQAVPVDHPDARIHYGLQDQQDEQEFDRRVEAEYVREFIENARREGVKVTLDKNQNVIDVEPLPGRGRRQPGSFDQGSTR